MSFSKIERVGCEKDELPILLKLEELLILDAERIMALVLSARKATKKDLKVIGGISFSDNKIVGENLSGVFYEPSNEGIGNLFWTLKKELNGGRYSIEHIGGGENYGYSIFLKEKEM